VTGQFRKFVETRGHLIVLVFNLAQSFLPSNNIGLWEVKLQLFKSPRDNPNWPDMVVYGVKDSICARMAFEYAAKDGGHGKQNRVQLLSDC
jgi:hypothetical protein